MMCDLLGQDEVNNLLDVMLGEKTMAKTTVSELETRIKLLEDAVLKHNAAIEKHLTDIGQRINVLEYDFGNLKRRVDRFAEPQILTSYSWIDYCVDGIRSYGRFLKKNGLTLALVTAVTFFAVKYFQNEYQNTPDKIPAVQIAEPELGILKKATEQYTKDVRDMGKAEALELFRLNTAAVREHYPNWKGLPE
jgi:hypothetical protein